MNETLKSLKRLYKKYNFNGRKYLNKLTHSNNNNSIESSYNFRPINVDNTTSESEFKIHQKNLSNMKFLMRFRELTAEEQEKLTLKLIARNLVEATLRIEQDKHNFTYPINDIDQQ